MTTDPSPRQRWLKLLACSNRQELADLLDHFQSPDGIEVVRPAETGTVMLEGRAGGTGRRFNLGEATVTRCVVRVDGRLGFSYALGGDRTRAIDAAILDALFQNPANAETRERMLSPIAERRQAARDTASRKAATTKVDFFTLVRGD